MHYHRLYPLRISGIPSNTPFASWKGNRVSDSSFHILEVEKLKNEERKGKEKKGIEQEKNPDLLLLLFMYLLLPPLRGVICAMVLWSGVLQVFFTLCRHTHLR